MQLEKLDNIVREALVDKGFSIHYYMQFLSYALGCLRELNWDILNTVKSGYLEINKYNAAQIPCDCVDLLKLGTVYNGQFNEWLEDDALPRGYYVDQSGAKAPFPANDSPSDLIALLEPLEFDHYGRQFNHGAGKTNYRYKILLERNEIQLASKTTDGLIMAEWITDGMTLDGCNKIHPYAIQTIKDYTFWQHKRHSRAYGEGERQKAEDLYYNELRKAKARLQPWGIEDIIRIAREGEIATVKR